MMTFEDFILDDMFKWHKYYEQILTGEELKRDFRDNIELSCEDPWRTYLAQSLDQVNFENILEIFKRAK